MLHLLLFIGIPWLFFRLIQDHMDDKALRKDEEFRNHYNLPPRNKDRMLEENYTREGF